MSVSIQAPISEPDDALERGLRAVWEQHSAGMFENVESIERAIGLLRTGAIDAQLHADARRRAHMLSGSLGLFGFARESDAAHRLELGLSEAATAQPATLSALLAIVSDRLIAERVRNREPSRTPHSS